MGRFQESKYGVIALGISIAEAVFIWGGLAVLRASGLWGRPPVWVEPAFSVVYLGGLAGLALAVVGLVKRSGPIYAALGLALGLINFGVGGLLFTV
jgi:hypothetical protein